MEKDIYASDLWIIIFFVSSVGSFLMEASLLRAGGKKIKEVCD